MAQKKNDDGLTPMMRQFYTFKKEHPDALLLFRCGDFYETYADDAVEASKILGITLTRRSNGKNQSAAACEMAGFPYHALDTYLPKLIRAGKRVAICDQLEDPKLTKTLVKRGITELVTPGVAMDDTVLNYKENNFLAAVCMAKTACGVAFLDISTGEFLTGEGTFDYVEKLLSSIQPKEVLYDRQLKREFEERFGSKWCVFELDDWMLTEQSSRQKLLSHFGTTTLKGFGVDHLHLGVTAAGAILQYLEMTQHTQIGHITSLARIDADRYVRLDRFTIHSLELLQSMQDDGVSLLSVIDRTCTPMGGRLLRRWTIFPLRDVASINKRLDVVDTFFRKPDFRQTVDEHLHRIGDIERIISKVAVGRVSPREVVQLKYALGALKPIKAACLTNDNAEIHSIGDQINLCEALYERIDRELQQDPPQLVAKGGVIAAGFSPELDELRSISRGGRDYLLKIQEEEAQKTGIQSLKVGYNNVFGYYLEVRNTYKDQVPQEWIRKQTLANAERYITEELKQYEQKIMGADEQILVLETRLFTELVTDMQAYIPQIQADANIGARLDWLLAFAKTAEEHRYVRPVVEDDNVLEIRAGRHPVIETQLPLGEEYVPNDIELDTEQQQIMIITGPNMAGKSALLRQTALITLMAQMGCFVPADSAHVGVVDKIFTRVGASDNISLGETTFMVEMTEVSEILHQATPRSLLILDEIGRGTSTFDGMSIARAVLEFCADPKKLGAKTLFATHYHELTELEGKLDSVNNYCIAVKEKGDDIVFLRKNVKGGADRSYGIQVSKLAGLPDSVIESAKEIAEQLLANDITDTVKSISVDNGHKHKKEHLDEVDMTQISLFDTVKDDDIIDELRSIDIGNMTPLDALNKLYQLQNKVKNSW